MGKRGPKPTPTAVLKLRGSTLVTKDREAREVKGPVGTPACPKWLDADAKAAWKHVVPLLEGMGVLTKVDGHALARYCRMWSRWRKMEAFIEEKGEMYPLRNEKGEVKCFQQWPQVLSANGHIWQRGLPKPLKSRPNSWSACDGGVVRQERAARGRYG